MDWSNTGGFHPSKTIGKPSKPETNWSNAGGFTGNTFKGPTTPEASWQISNTVEIEKLKHEIEKLKHEVTRLTMSVAQITAGQSEIIKHLTMLVARQEQFYHEFVDAVKRK